MSNYLTFQEFINAEDAEEMAVKLRQQGIPVIIEKNPDLLGQELIGRQYNSFVALKIPGEKFVEAQQALITNTSVDIDSVDKNYMLFSLSNEELMDVIAKPDEWGAYNYNLAHLILNQRSVSIDEQHVGTLQKEHIDVLSQQRTVDITWLFLGYFFSGIGIIAGLVDPSLLLLVYGISMLPGILGIIMGAVVLLTKKTLPDGRSIMSYNAKTRRHGTIMVVIGILSILFAIAIGIAHKA